MLHHFQIACICDPFTPCSQCRLTMQWLQMLTRVIMFSSDVHEVNVVLNAVKEPRVLGHLHLLSTPRDLVLRNNTTIIWCHVSGVQVMWILWICHLCAWHRTVVWHHGSTYSPPFHKGCYGVRSSAMVFQWRIHSFTQWMSRSFKHHLLHSYKRIVCDNYSISPVYSRFTPARSNSRRQEWHQKCKCILYKALQTLLFDNYGLILVIMDFVRMQQPHRLSWTFGNTAN